MKSRKHSSRKKSKSHRKEMNSIIYTLDSKQIPCKDNPKYKTSFIRKHLDLGVYQSKTELMIATKLLNSPCPNVVEVYAISKDSSPPYIDYQKLDVSQKLLKEDIQKYHKDIQNGLDHLHALNIIFIYLDRNRVGYDVDKKEWCLFGFDGCGICSASKFIRYYTSK